MGINFDEIEAELHQEMEKERRKEAQLEELRQRRYALMEQVDAIDAQTKKILDPTGEGKNSVLLCGSEISGTWLLGKYGITRLTSLPL